MSASGLGVGSPPKDSPSKRDDRRLSSSSGNSGGGLRRRLSLGSRHSASSTSSMVINSVLGSLGMGDKSKEKERDRSSGSSDNQQLRPPSLDSGVRSKRSSRSPSMRLSGLQPQRVSPHSFNSKMDPIPPVPRLPPSPTHTTKTSASNLKPKPGYRRDPVTGEIIKFHIGIVSSWPEALVSFDVPKKKTSLERCQGYAKKMTQLLEEESGLGEWVESVKYRGRPARRDTIRSSPSDRFVSPSSPVSAGFNGRFQTRHVSGGSGGSVMTEVTFPVRPMDAYVATDLPVRASDSTINGPPANLPFPGLFQQQAKGVFSSSGSGLKPSASVRTFIKAAGGSNGSSGGTGLGLTGAPQSNSLKGPQAPAPTGKNGSNSGSNGSSGGGFFASIGRKASISMSKPTILTTVMKAASNNPAPLALPSPPAPSSFPISGNPMSPVRSRSMVAGLGGHVQRVTGGPRPLPSANSKQQQAPITQHRSTPSRASTILIIGRKSNESGSDGSNHKTRRVLSPDIENDAATESDVGALPVFPKVPTKTTHQPLGPRPSLSYRTSVKSNTTLGEDARAVLNTNLEKLGDLLPYVDRPTLSLYLNKAGGDDLKAIGMYLEDEKRGMVMSK
ncbi:hypothetical protein FRC02_007981 [Tulasnella sp. 418]|nr:hypothetical protein FRC02_007981 [Tulasnella sp. 418]